MNKIKTIFQELRQKSLVRDSFWMLLSQGFSIIFQTFYFILLARSLGAQEYGAFVGALSLANIVTPFSGWGGSHIIFKYVSKDRNLINVYLGNAIVLIAASAPLLTILALLFSPIIFSGKLPLIVVLCTFLADLVGLKLIEASTASLMSTDAAKYAALIGILLHASKFSAALIFSSLFPDNGVITWALLYCGASLLVASIAVSLVISRLGFPKFQLKRLKRDLLDGFYFSISGFSDGINGSLDQTMLASISTLKAAGVYNAAARFIGMGMVFMISFAGASYSKFFQHGAAGINGSWNFAKKLLPLAFAYGIFIFLVFIFAAPFIPYVLGESVEEALPILRCFAPLILMMALSYLASDSLTGAGFQGIRSSIQVSSALLNFFLNLWLIPQYSVYGAVWATLATELAKLIGLYTTVFILKRRQLARNGGA
ncbi:MAG: oligosaccharide flippase family protein [Nostoc sp. C3-bin3]|nr:oligosaccharide flippase family protein [Nostoc sp. C3-bin3]